MKKGLLLLLLVTASFSIFAQEDEEKEKKYTFSLGLNSGLIFNSNAYLTTSDHSDFKEYYGINPKANYGIDLGIRWSDKVRTRFEFKYMTLGYGVNWKESSDYNKTEVSLYTLGFNFQFDYLVYTKNKLQLYVSPGVISEFVTGHDYKNTKDNGNVSYKLVSPMKKQYLDSYYGGNLSVLAKYTISKRVSVSFTPGYTVFFTGFAEDNSNLYSRFSCIAGIDLLLF